MSIYKMMAIINGYKAVRAEDNLEQLNIVANPSLLETKKGAKEYPKLFKAYKKQAENNGIKQVTVKANLNELIRMAREQGALAKGGKDGRES